MITISLLIDDKTEKPLYDRVFIEIKLIIRTRATIKPIFPLLEKYGLICRQDHCIYNN